MGRLSQAVALANMTSSDRRKFASGKGSDVYFTKLTITNELLKAIPPAKDYSYDFVAVDVETATGSINSICQIALVGSRNGELEELFSSLVQPPNNEIWESNSAIHGIYPDQTLKAPSFPVVWEQIAQYFSNLVVAHNASFDISRIVGTLEHYGMQSPNINYECTYQLSGKKLKDACSEFGLELKNHHEALADAMACAELYAILKEKNKKHRANQMPVPKTNEEKNSGGNYFASKRLESELLKPITDVKDNYFKGKRLVFTGDLQELSRTEAAQIVRELGADINTSISKKTDVIVLGRNPGPSKMDKIKNLMEAGVSIRLIEEPEFLDLINAEKG